MSDLVERLRENPVAYAETAAKELERLRAELANVRQIMDDAEVVIRRQREERERLRAELADAEKMCDSYAAENQRISDERDRLRELLREALDDVENRGLERKK